MNKKALLFYFSIGLEEALLPTGDNRSSRFYGILVWRWSVFFCSFLLLFFVVPNQVSAEGPDVSASIKEILLASAGNLRHAAAPGFSSLTGETLDFYQSRGYAPVWQDDKKLFPEAMVLLDCLRSSSAEGFCPEDYHVQKLGTLIALLEFTVEKWRLVNSFWSARLDILLTDAFMRYASDCINGRVSPRKVGNRWGFPKKQRDLGQLLSLALEKHSFCGLMAEIKPTFPGYGRLASGLAQYRALVAAGGWTRIPAGPTLRLGDRDPRIVFLRQRLVVTGELERLIEQNADLFDSSLKTALIRFQRRHGLKDDGALGTKTLGELNVSAEDRVRQIELNLERLRWLPESLGGNYLGINIPDLQLTVYEQGEPVMAMPVIVGRAYRKTPVFSAPMKYLEFSPYWYVPPTILKEDKLPKIKNDPGWLEKNHFEIIPWRGKSGESVDPDAINWAEVEPDNFPGMLRQKPGPWNPLGRVKFIFPNPYAVYLHDTNQRHLFSHNIRLFSSGCIRIERPLDLAYYLLKGVGWSYEDLVRAMNLSDPLRVDLPREIPVFIFYMTAWVDHTGAVQFRKDTYYKDRILDHLLMDREGDPGDL